MKLSARDIPSFLQEPDSRHRAALVYGPDEGLVRERIKSIAIKLVGDMTDPFNVADLGEDAIKTDPSRLFEELAAISFTGGKRLVMVRDAGDKLSEHVKSALPLQDNQAFLLIAAGDLSPRSSLRQLCEKDSQFAALPCYKDEGRGLEIIIKQSLDKNGLHAEPDVIHYLSHNLGNDRGVTLSELEKLAVYAGAEKRLALEDVYRLVGNNSDMTLDDLCNAIAAGELRNLEILQERLRNEGVHAVVVFRSLQRYFQRMYLLMTKMEAGMSLDQAIGELKPPVFFRQVPLLKAQITRWSRRKVVHAMNLLLKAEREAKSTGAAQDSLCGYYITRIAQAVR